MSSPEPTRSWPVRRNLIPETGPQRRLALGGFVNQLGTAAFGAGVPLYAVRVIGLSIGQVSIGLSVAAVAGLVTGIPVGHLADRYGPRAIYAITLFIQSVSMTALLFAHSWWAFVLAVTVTDLAGSSGGAARGPLIRRIGGEEVPKFRSYLRSTAMLASTLGALAAGIAIQFDTGTAYRVLIAGNAFTFVISAVIAGSLPRLAPLAAPHDSGRWIALRDKRYVSFVLLDSVMWIQAEVLSFALPLWVVWHTDAPRWFAGAAIAINTVMVVLLQIRASRHVTGVPAAARAFRRAGLAFLIGMAVIATAATLPGWAAVAIMIAGVIVHTVGSLWHGSGSLELRFRLAPAHAQGQYSGLFGMGMGLCYTVAPSLLGLLCVAWGAPGWFVMGGVFLIAGAVMPSVIRLGRMSEPDAEAG